MKVESNIIYSPHVVPNLFDFLSYLLGTDSVTIHLQSKKMQ